MNHSDLAGETRIPGHICNMQSSVATTHNARKRASHAAWHTWGRGTWEPLVRAPRAGGSASGDPGAWHGDSRENHCLLLKPYSRDGGLQSETLYGGKAKWGAWAEVFLGLQGVNE